MLAHSRLPKYAETFSLTGEPFSLAPDPRFVYESASFTGAYASVLESLRRREALIVITGEAGTGKTTLCRYLLQRLPERTFVSVVFNPFVSFEELLWQVLIDFGVIRAHDFEAASRPMSVQTLVRTLHRFLGTLASLDARAVVVIDEAQHLTTDMLERIRTLSNFETDTTKLLQIMLVGQPALAGRINSQDLIQLRQRISCLCELHPLGRGELGGYVARRLDLARLSPAEADGNADLSPKTPDVGPPDDADASTAAGAEAAVEKRGVRARPSVAFSNRAIRRLAATSRGIPRVVNLLCDRALDLAAAERSATVTAKHIDRAAMVLRLRRPLPRLVYGAAAAASIVVVALVGALVSPAWPAATSTAKPSTPATAPTKPVPSSATAPAHDGGNEPPSRAAALAAGIPERPLRVVDGYVVSLASFRTSERATAIVERLRGAGYPAYVDDRTAGWHAVAVGPFLEKSEAESSVQKLRREFPDARVSPAG